ncbi:tetraacyldisaccharide 4'-kinase [Pseudaestuariivita sp.]|uniref:tetraacyldisaccharide 4'-kinase n=1 Tax=Pseudaestuariivita sp. TaxID=2211669 RepID=UPI0040587A19
MRPPAFWTRPPERPGLAARLLAPLGALTAKATARRVAQAPAYDAAAPVICVGNLTAGGAGKTPTVIALIQELAARGKTAAVLSRGYGGKLEGPVRVDPAVHSAADVGDEPLLMQAFAEVWVSRDRAAGARAMEAAGARDVILLDDGFQNPGLAKDLSIIVADAETGFGNGRCLPAGPLREPVAAGMGRADLVLSLGLPPAQAQFRQTWADQITVPHLTGHLAPLETGMPWSGARVLAFAGIGRPEKFFTTLRALGAEVVETVPLSDHQPLSPRLMARLKSDAQRLGAQLVTTEKDAIRLSQADLRDVLAVPVRLQIEDPAPLHAALDRLGL